MDRNQTLAILRERIVTHAASRLQRDVAEDLAQEVLMLIQEKYAHVDSLSELLPLCFQILRFKMMSFVRRSVRRGEYKQVSLEDLPLADPEQDPATRAEVAEMRDRLRTAIAQLEGRCREMFRLKLEGKTFPEIQAILKVGSLNTIYTWDFRCRKSLLKLMGGHWEANR